ncbi:MAG: hypothetical protein M0R70_15255 [Nitrospirae bacterium]|nr:hypothetical protein [Nitrospirota bacterium]
MAIRFCRIVAVVDALLFGASVAVTVMALSPQARFVTVQLHVLAVGYVTTPGVAVVSTAIVTTAPVSMLPVMVWVVEYVGDVTGLMLTVGGTVSTVKVVSVNPTVPEPFTASILSV